MTLFYIIYQYSSNITIQQQLTGDITVIAAQNHTRAAFI